MNNYLLYSLTVLIWGTTWYVIKFQLGVVSPDVSVAYRFLLAGVTMLAFCLIMRRNLHFSITSHLFFVLQGLFLFCMNYILFYHSTIVLTTGLIAVVFTSMLIFNTLGSALFFKTPITGSIVLASLLGISGIALIFLPELKRLDFEHSTVIALLLAIGGSISASLGNMVSMRNQRHKLPVIEANTFGMLYGGLLTCIYAYFSGSAFNFDFSPSYVISLVYLAIFGSVIAFWSYLTLLGRLGAGNAAYATVLFPIVALLISTVYENYQWSFMAVVGVLISLAGNVLILNKPNR